MYIPLIKIKISIKKYTRDDSKMCVPTPTPHPQAHGRKFLQGSTPIMGGRRMCISAWHVLGGLCLVHHGWPRSLPEMSQGRELGADGNVITTGLSTELLSAHGF